MRIKMLVLAVMVLFGGLASFNSASQASQLPDFGSWTVLHSGREDYDKDGVDDFAFKLLNDTPNPKTASDAAFLFYFRPIDSNRIDLAIVSHFIRTNEPGKDTILFIRFSFYARQGSSLVFVEERILSRPKDVWVPVTELMFEETSLFGQRYFQEWRKLGFSDGEIRQHIPKWGWLPEN